MARRSFASFKVAVVVAIGSAGLAAPSAQAQNFSCTTRELPTPERWIEFDVGSDRIGPKGKDVIKELAERATATYQTQICVVGRASKLGNAEDNRQLSLRRAQAVVNALKASKVKGEYLKAEAAGEGFGKSLSSSKNNSPDDRRVEVYFMTGR